MSMAPEGRCFDLDGDGKVDNGLAGLLGLLGQFIEGDLGFDVQQYIDDGELVALLEYRGVVSTTQPTPVELSAMLGQHLDPIATAKAGLGHFKANFDAFDPASGLPLSNLNGSQSAGKFTVGPGNGALRLAAAATIAVGSNGAGLDMANGKMGGAISIDAFADAFNTSLAACGCFGLTGSGFSVVTTDPKKLKLGCSASFNAAVPNCGVTDSQWCQTIADDKALVCPALGVLPFDQDLDGDGQRDAISFGLTFEAVSATIVGVQ
jgi:hypothetical protein